MCPAVNRTGIARSLSSQKQTLLPLGIVSARESRRARRSETGQFIQVVTLAGFISQELDCVVMPHRLVLRNVCTHFRLKPSSLSSSEGGATTAPSSSNYWQTAWELPKPPECAQNRCHLSGKNLSSGPLAMASTHCTEVIHYE